MILEGKVGQANLADGAVSEFRQTRTGDMAVSEAHARYWDAVCRGNVFLASQQAAAALGTALTATAVTLTLYNPVGSGRNVVLLQTGLAVVTATTAGFAVYAVNGISGQAAPASVTILASGIQNALVGSGNQPVAQVYSAATLPAAPVARRVLAGILGTTPTSAHMLIDDVQGSIVLGPGMMVTVQGITSNVTGVLSYLWEEVNI